MKHIIDPLFQPQSNQPSTHFLIKLFNQNLTISYQFFYSEFKTAFYFNMIFSVLLIAMNTIFEYQYVFNYLWIQMFCLCNLINLSAKTIIIFRIESQHCIDRQFISSLFKSKIYHYNNLIGQTLLLLYCILFIKNITQMSCLSIWQYSSINLELMTYLILIQFVIRSILSLRHLDSTTQSIFKTNQNASQIQTQIDRLTKYTVDHGNYGNIGNEECSICLEKYGIGQKVKQLQCVGKHIFHEKCIDGWLKNRLRCPNCQCMSI